jgi:arabinosyltransferase C
LPYLVGWSIEPENALYLGVHSNYDDHAVYASWTDQSKDGRFFFENRFTTDSQPRRTIQLYFLGAGWLAKLVGVPLALHVFRVVFGMLALLGIYRLVERAFDAENRMLAFLLGATTAGCGFAFWKNYGFEGPIDVWQPEAFIFPSLMQNGLFCAAIWLITVVWRAILDSEESWSQVWKGCIALLVLTNIHTYDTLAIAIIAVGFLATVLGAGRFRSSWMIRSAVIGAGAMPAVAWFVYVRGIDPVFAARADTVTISATLGMVVLGLFPAILLAGYGLLKYGNVRGVALAIILFIGIGIAQATSYRMDAAWGNTSVWFVLAAIGVFACFLYKPVTPMYGFLFSWIVMGLLALYYPGLFQRKLAMALALPIGIATTSGILRLPNFKPAYAWPVILILGASNLFWLVRETTMATRNISNTTMQNIYWQPEIAEYLKYFRENANDSAAVIAMPGIAVPDDFAQPREYAVAIPDLNPVLTGWGKVKTFVGHWSETPNYLDRRRRVMRDLFSPQTTTASAYLLMKDARADFILAPTTDLALQAGVPPRDFYAGLGQVVYEGDRFILVRFLASP